MSIKDELYTVEDIARIFKVGRRTIYKWVEKGLINCIYINKKTLRFRLADVEDFIVKHTIKNQEKEIDEVVDEILSKLN